MINAGIAGLGWWGKTLVEAVSGQSDQIRFVAAATEDVDDETRAFVAQHEIELLADFDALIANPNVDAVVLATPNSMHVDQVVAAAAKGKHVFCEKPLALTKAGADRAVEATQKAGVTLAVDYNRRWHPETTKLRELIDSIPVVQLRASLPTIERKRRLEVLALLDLLTSDPTGLQERAILLDVLGIEFVD